MAQMMQNETIREAVAVFEDRRKLDEAVTELEAGFPRQDISMLASEKAEQKFGKKAGRAVNLEDNPDAPRTVPVLPEERALGHVAIIGGFAYVAGCIAAVLAKDAAYTFLLAAIAGGSIGGGLIGAVIAFALGARLSRGIDRQIKNGGIVLWVRTPDKDSEKRAYEILKKQGGRHIHFHKII